jgi:DNA-binding transcriptional MocR family regulator
MPSVRTLARQYRVSISTAVQAYRQLEIRRLVEARPKSGFFAAASVPPLAEPRASRASAARFVVTSPIAHEYLASISEPDLVPLGRLQSDPALYPTERLARLLGTVARRNAAAMGMYGAMLGEERLRRAIARRAAEGGCAYGPGEIVVTAGCVEALNLALRAVAKPGDTIALESPTYFVMLQMIEQLGMKALEIPTHPRTGISLEALDFATRERGAVRAVMVTPSFSNPLGCVMPEANRAALVAMCDARGIPVIEDDVYGEVWFEGSRPLPLKAWDRSGNVLLCSSFSKSLAPGLRVGWVAPGRFLEPVTMLKAIGSIFAPPLPQLAIAEFVETGGYDHQLRRLRAHLGQRSRRLAELIARTFPEGTRLSRPAGGYVLWVELPGAANATELFRRARTERILLAPGQIFSSTGRYRNALRFSFALAPTPEVEKAVARVGRMAHA